MSEENISEPTSESSFGSALSRRDALIRAGQVGAGALVAGALGSDVARAAIDRTMQKPTRGGTLTWALEQDPVYMAPFGSDLTANRWGTEVMYESLLEWDKNLNLRPALAEKWEVVDPKTIIFTLRRGVFFHNGKELTAADCKYSFDLQANPPPPGSKAVLGQFPAIAGTDVLGKYRLRMRLSAPDARVFGYLAWQRWSCIVPEGTYDDINVIREGIGTGPFRLTTYVPADRVEYVRNPRYWKPGLPYLNAVNYKVLTDEQARIAALRAGAIDGATLSPDGARQFRGNANFKVLSNFTAAFKDIIMTIKPGDKKPWYDKRVRQAVSYAINRQEIIDRVYSGFGEYSGHIPPGYGPWPLPTSELRKNYLKYDLAKARTLLRQAGYANGFEVTMNTFAAPIDNQQVSAVVQAQLKKVGIEVKINALEAGAHSGPFLRGDFEWDLLFRGMRGDPDGFTAEFNPTAPINKAWWPAWRPSQRIYRNVGNGRITLDQAKRLPMYKQLERDLLDEMPAVPLIAVKKFQVVRKRVNNMFVSFTDFNPGIRTIYIK
jgi:peptide/nickel transport system substrate-binding protein